MTTLRPAFAYCRVSRKEIETGSQSLNMQRERILQYAPVAGLEIVDIFIDDGVSGGKPIDTRPAGSRMVKRLSNGEAVAVVGLKLDRVFRDALDALGSVNDWEDTGIDLHLVEFGGAPFATSSPSGKLFFTMLAAFAEFERAQIGERVRANKASRKAAGRSYAVPRFGYANEEGRVATLDSERSILDKMHEMRKDGASLRRIARWLNESGVPTKQGGAKWYPATVSGVLNREV